MSRLNIGLLTTKMISSRRSVEVAENGRRSACGLVFRPEEGMPVKGDRQDPTPADSAGAPPLAQPSGSAPTTVPEDVERLAASRGFGNLLDVRHEISAKRAMSTGLATVIVSVALIGVDGWIFLPRGGEPSNLRKIVIQIIGLFLLFSAIDGARRFFRGLFVGSRSHYLYADGLVHKKRSGPVAIGWREVATFRSVHSRRANTDTSKILGYRVAAQDGRSFVIPIVPKNGGDAFMDLIIGNLRTHGHDIE